MRGKKNKNNNENYLQKNPFLSSRVATGQPRFWYIEYSVQAILSRVADMSIKE